MKTALLSTSTAVAVLAVASIKVLLSGTQRDHREPYRFEAARLKSFRA